MFIAGSGVEVKKKVPTTSKIYVININGTKETMYLEQAEKIARHNNYKLLKVDSNLNKELYQFCKGSYTRFSILLTFLQLFSNSIAEFSSIWF